MAVISVKSIGWEPSSRDEEGNREYKLKWQVITNDKMDGPYTVLNASGLPQYGDKWTFGNDDDQTAYCRDNVTITPILTRDNNTHWDLEFTFSTKPAEVSGTFSKHKAEAYQDIEGVPIQNSSHEQIRGSKVEFDENRMVVKIEQWVPALQMDLWGPMNDTVNDAPLWGFAKRCIKMTPGPWKRRYNGLGSSKWYSRSFEFEIRPDGFDADIADEGTKVINGHWDKVSGLWVRDPVPKTAVLNPDVNGVYTPGIPINPDPDNPTHFRKAIDKDGNSIRSPLNGVGEPVVPFDQAKTTTCAQCPDGTWLKWLVTGFAIPYVLNYTGLCGWSATNGTNVLTLTAGATLWTLSLNTGGVFQARWSLPLINWECNGPNTLSKDLGGVAFVDFLTLSGGLSKQGVIHVEFYEESNFLLLDTDPHNPFPTDLG